MARSIGSLLGATTFQNDHDELVLQMDGSDGSVLLSIDDTRQEAMIDMMGKLIKANIEDNE